MGKLIINISYIVKKTIAQRPLAMIMIAVFACIGVSACVSVITPQNPIDHIPDKSSAITASRMDMGEVRNIFGDPLISSRYWGVEVFREATSQLDVPVFIVVPFGVQKDDIYRYTLVSYSKDKTAESVATGIFRKPRFLGPITTENLTLFLQTGDFTFVIEERDKLETLLVKPAKRDAYLQLARSSSQCTVVVGCNSYACSSALTVDKDPSLPIPYRAAMTAYDKDALNAYRQGTLKDIRKTYKNVQYDSLAVVSLMPGEHTLKVSEGRWQEGGISGGTGSGEQSISFACRRGEILYLVIQLSASEYSRFGSKDVEWRIDLHNEMPKVFFGRDLVIYRGGQWITNPKSGD